ncbi:hypothetical protein CAEBREN_02577 [Caenorhabditis brenneri]|uniref:Uncharacterized protein n=1 Tax=Caenorhabditis brenneri TaxID=135651 RepID=G0PC60_CAEBE|nr:hypothetical protein CAEBREN_02577 [Caenorhabditis brenneri]
MMFPFYLYVLFTIFYLLFLGGYFFFVNIFHKEMVKVPNPRQKQHQR